MNDPRLAEIEFLTKLDRAEQKTLLMLSENAVPRPDTCGLPLEVFRRMVASLIMQGYLNGPDTLTVVELANQGVSAAHAAQAVAWNDSRELLNLLSGKHATLWISHRGRIRLRELREEQWLKRTREDFGILLSKRHFDADLFVQLLDASPSKPLSLVAMDLDNFKSVNDTHGHAEGDRVITATFTIQHALLSAFGEVYRVGSGDEVTAILPGVAFDRAKELAERVRIEIESKFRGEPYAPPVTLSAGVSTTTERVDIATAKKQVDDALYMAKHAGKNRVSGNVPPAE